MDLGLRLPSIASFMMMSLPGHACTGSQQVPNRPIPEQMSNKTSIGCMDIANPSSDRGKINRINKTCYLSLLQNP